jgi:putative membrane protein
MRNKNSVFLKIEKIKIKGLEVLICLKPLYIILQNFLWKLNLLFSFDNFLQASDFQLYSEKFIFVVISEFMRVYNTKHFIKILFSLHKSDTLKILFPSMILVGLYSWGIQYLEVEYLHLTSKSGISNVGMIHSLLGFVLSLFIGFQDQYCL